MGRVAALWRFPVKAIAGEVMASMDVGATGCVGDRAYALIDADTGKIVENTWAGRGVQVGDGIQLRVQLRAPRCSVTTLAQAGLPHDPEVRKTIAVSNPVPVAGKTYPVVGVYADVDRGDTIRVGDAVRVSAAG